MTGLQPNIQRPARPLIALDLRRAGFILIACFAPALLFYVASVCVLHFNGFSVTQILRDPAQLSNTSSFWGFLSSIGNAVWVAAGAICFFAMLLRHTAASGNRELLLWVGTLSLALGFDDFFMIHDRYVDQRICYGFYAVITMVLAARHLGRILRIEPFAFFAAAALLGGSILSDLIQYMVPVRYTITQLFEEGLKFCGIAMWMFFAARVALDGQPASDER